MDPRCVRRFEKVASALDVNFAVTSFGNTRLLKGSGHVKDDIASSHRLNATLSIRDVALQQFCLIRQRFSGQLGRPGQNSDGVAAPD